MHFVLAANFRHKKLALNCIQSLEILGYTWTAFDLGGLGFGTPLFVRNKSFHKYGLYEGTVASDGGLSSGIHKPAVIAAYLTSTNQMFAYLDADTVVRRPIDEVLGDYDIGVTIRPQSEWARLGRINAGVLFFNPTERTKSLVQNWKTLTETLKNDQRALTNLLTAGDLQLNVVEFPALIYNWYYFPRTPPGSAKILHYKVSQFEKRKKTNRGNDADAADQPPMLADDLPNDELCHSGSQRQCTSPPRSETGMITIVCTYHNHHNIIPRHLEAWHLHRHKVDYILVGHEPPEPLIIERHPPRLRTYRILTGVPWTTAGAKNLGAFSSNTPWILFVDLDNLITAEALDLIFQLDLSTPNLVHYFGPFGADRTPRNDSLINMLISRPMFLRIGGFDEDFSDFDGTGDQFFLQCLRAAKAIVVKRPEIQLMRTPGTGTTAVAGNGRRNIQVYQEKLKLLRQGEYRHGPVLRFSWQRGL